ncbi:CoA-binding protein [Motiliproteus sp. MSK22-1]|uniref:CoA-binding protein n=1 Tax=Motiliproteus sp. MSK22-1 TaxID=1897630 RepID=UPI000976019D|nr:CoA-binding protein [Motiliproteus sp. MSK22-1]OMH29069.1 acyl-CoA synthetase [Motiliproteus sp. MSK22-1]
MNNPTSAFTESSLSFDFEEAGGLLAKAASEQRDSLSINELSQLCTGLGLQSLTRPERLPEAILTQSMFVEIRNTREFGMIISAGLGGVNQEQFATSFAKDEAKVCASTTLTDASAFFELFKRSFCYKQLAGLVTDEQLLSCFSGMIALANYFSPDNPKASYVIDCLAINPLIFTDGLMIPLDGHCRFSEPADGLAARPIEKIGKLLHPESIGIIGVSASKMNFGRIILKNLLGSGYDAARMTIVRPGGGEIDGVNCVDNLDALTHKLDLFIVAIGAEGVFDLVDEVIASDAAESVMLVPGGLGETQNSYEPAAAMKKRINAAHLQKNGGPVFLGGNCLGVVSHPGGYDSWFIPRERLPKPQKKAQRHSALISQSGAFMVTRLSKNPWLDPAYMTALGNQSDISHGDMLSYYVDQETIDTIGVYIEGFNDLDGLAFADAARRAVLKGKQVIVYKAGRTNAGKSSALGHTASEAGDYSLCESILKQAGVMVAKDFTEFDDLFYIASCMHNRVVGGRRVAGVSGAGFETVGMADSIASGRFSLEMSLIEPSTAKQLENILVAKRLDALMEVRNPIDINPGADDEAHVQCTQAFAEASNVDAVVVGLDPLSPMMRTLAQCSRPGFDLDSELSVAQLLPALVREQQKPIIGVVDGGGLYDAMAEKLMDQGVCVFRSCERAMESLARYTEARLFADQLRSQLQ